VIQGVRMLGREEVWHGPCSMGSLKRERRDQLQRGELAGCGGDTLLSQEVRVLRRVCRHRRSWLS
jgi:hypothetical protein